MKKISLLISTVVAALSLASCQKEQTGPAGVEGDYATVNIAVHAPGQLVTKAVGDGQTADNLVFAVFDEAGDELIDLRQGDWIKNQTELTFNQTDANGNPMTTVKTTLVRGKEYTFVCWAQNKEAVCYDFTSLKEIGVDYSTYNVAQNEKRDAFYAAVQSGKVTDDFSMSIELRRPFAQINVGTDDIQAAHSAGLQVNNLYATMTVANVATKLHTFVGEKAEDNDGDGKVEGNTNVTFTLAPSISKPTLDDATKVWSPNEEWLTVNHEAYKGQNFGWLAMNYILVNDGDIQGGGSVDGTEPVNTTVSFTVYEGEGLELCSYDVPNVTVQRNYRTHILGSVLTAEGTLNVIIEPAFINDEDHVVEIWDGHTVSEPKKDAQGNYLVTKPEELAWVAKQVNEEGKTFEGVTVYLTSDIDLAGQVWTPIGAGETPFKGTFEVLPSPLTKSAAEYCAIYGLNVNYTEGPAGLFGWLNGTVKNVTLDAPVVKGETCVGAVAGKIFNSGLVDGCQVNGGSVYGNHYVGGVVGYAYGSVTNCVVDGVAVTGAAVQGNEDLDGDKVGGVLGFHPADADGTEVSGNTVLDVNVAAKRDAAAVVGAANADNVKGNHVEKATIGSTEAQISDAGVIVGRVIAGTLNPKANTYNHEQITVNGVKAESAVFEFSAKAASEEVLPVEGGKYVISVTGNVDWTLTLPEGLTSDVEDGKGFGAATITVTVPANEAYEPAEYTVVVKTEAELTEPEAATEYTFTISQVAAEPPFKVATVAEFLAAAEDNTVYQLTGVITKVVNTEYGNFDITDETGTVYIYGLCSPEGQQKYWAESGAKLGDTITIQTARTSFSGSPQGKNAIFVGLVPFVETPSEWGVVGDLTSWGSSKDIVMYNTWKAKDLFVAYNVEIASGAFKIRANNEWNDAKNYGLEAAGKIYADKYYTLINGAGSQDATPMKYGTYDVYFDLANERVALVTPGKEYADAENGGDPVVVVEGLKDHEWGLIGSFAGYDWNADVAMEVVGDWAVAKNVTLANGNEFKFRADGAWALSYGSGCDVNVGETYTTYNNGQNMKFVGEDGAYNIYFSLVDAKFYMETYISTTTVEATMASFGWANAAAVETATLDENVTLTFEKGGASTAPAYYTSGEAVRLYQNGAIMNVSANGRTISSIEITFANNMYYLAADSGEFSEEASVRTWTGSADAVKFTCTGTDKSHRAYISAIKVTYE